ncbi:hypothetical protein GCM10023115_38640 [Pontixanthobacter gangjinensis]|uniref:Rhodanese-like domain-containing protein n=1 Tax=Christiangramia aestuarii TaxID=1028746 RepID=A0A7M3SWL8_9FLAO|nr:rhodanese-like domain-containing protein [Christiangramia aestuarii]MUP40999.1 rhodanese-like domain-containing protein [Christiangramia aestuarii]
MSLLSTIFGTSSQQDDNIQLLSAEEFKTAINSNKVQLIDVRTPREFKQGAMQNAVNLDFFNQQQFRAGLEKLDKCEPVYVYCHSGGRSRNAASMMKKMGFEKTYDLKGGFSNY